MNTHVITELHPATHVVVNARDVVMAPLRWRRSRKRFDDLHRRWPLAFGTRS